MASNWTDNRLFEVADITPLPPLISSTITVDYESEVKEVFGRAIKYFFVNSVNFDIEVISNIEILKETALLYNQSIIARNNTTSLNDGALGEFYEESYNRALKQLKMDIALLTFSSPDDVETRSIQFRKTLR